MDYYERIMDKDLYIKRYYYSNLISSQTELHIRTNMIELISEKYPAIPEVKFRYDKEYLVYSQKRVSASDLQLDIPALFILSRQLEEITRSGLIHGDLNRKNILYSEGCFLVVDWEPCLLQIKKNCKALMFTPPYISLQDLFSNELSFRTDKIGWVFFILRIRNLLNSKLVAKMYSLKMKEKKETLPFPESDLDEMSFNSLTEEALGLKGMDYLYSL